VAIWENAGAHPGSSRGNTGSELEFGTQARSDGERGTLPIPSERNVRDLGDAILQNLMASLLEDHFREY
jgi:hypothetical protein